jgi:hypothetical protein
MLKLVIFADNDLVLIHVNHVSRFSGKFFLRIQKPVDLAFTDLGTKLPRQLNFLQWHIILIGL